jgi:hypothetical protein
MTKKDNCFDYSTVKVETDSLWQFFIVIVTQSKKRKLKCHSILKTKMEAEIYASSIDHSRHQGIQMLIRRDTTINKDIDDYYFSREVGFKQHKNINYDYNINSYLKNLQLIISRMISVINRKSKLTKTRR